MYQDKKENNFASNNTKEDNIYSVNCPDFIDINNHTDEFGKQYVIDPLLDNNIYDDGGYGEYADMHYLDSFKDYKFKNFNHK